MGRTTNGKGYTNSHTRSIKTQTPTNKSPFLQPQNNNYNTLFFSKSDRGNDLIAVEDTNTLLMMQVIAMRMR